MSRPFVVCHMLCSLDGRIDGSWFRLPETAPALRATGQIRRNDELVLPAGGVHRRAEHCACSRRQRGAGGSSL